MVPLPTAPHRLVVGGDALAANWRWLRAEGGAAACGACVKADGYGLGAQTVFARLIAAGCRDFFVSSWAEAATLSHQAGVELSVFHGVQPGEEAFAAAHWAKPVLCSSEQVERWRGTGLPCDVMVDTGMHRLGLSIEQVASGVLGGLRIDTVMSHLVAGEQDTPLNERQRSDFQALRDLIRARRWSLANSAGVALGRDYAFDLTRPGLSLYGGRPRAESAPIRPVATLEARVVQRHMVPAGETVGYNGLWRAEEATPVATVNLGYADGFRRALTNRGTAFGPDGEPLPIIGRVSMDLIALDASAATYLDDQAWITVPLDLPRLASAAQCSQYEILTGLGQRLVREMR